MIALLSRVIAILVGLTFIGKGLYFLFTGPVTDGNVEVGGAFLTLVGLLIIGCLSDKW